MTVYVASFDNWISGSNPRAGLSLTVSIVRSGSKNFFVVCAFYPVAQFDYSASHISHHSNNGEMRLSFRNKNSKKYPLNVKSSYSNIFLAYTNGNQTG